jgi:FkbM family methyltransferase
VSLNIVRIRESQRYGFKFAEVQGTPADHASWWSFDDEQEIRDRFWNPSRGDTVLDIGAAFGSYTLPALAMGARVVAFSPADFDTELLNLNLSQNPMLANRCLVVRDGIHERDGWFDPDNSVYVANRIADVSEHDAGQWLRVRSLDSFLEERPGIDGVDWIKLDIEGAELGALRGAENTLRRWKPRILVENHNFHDPKMEVKVRDYVTGLGVGYRCDGPHPHCAVSHSYFEARR